MNPAGARFESQSFAQTTCVEKLRVFLFYEIFSLLDLTLVFLEGEIVLLPLDVLKIKGKGNFYAPHNLS